MKWTGLNDLREKYLSFFESKGHLRLPSYPLVPINDKSLLLINSGMAPMKKFFTGEQEPPRRRVTTCQKCIRTPDLERVGHTARHGTYFEMLGNFSFGDYFKKEAIAWSWEFLTQTLEIPGELLWPSVYEKDEESYKLWTECIGVPAERVVKLGKADNFWEHGTGPCGPCSEIYFDRGIKHGCGSPDCKPGCDCDRYMEIWNNVFSQFDNDGNGNYTELAQKNIDTGMGLERLACVMQDVDNMFEVDTIRKILDAVCKIASKSYPADPSDDISIRVITDHIRSATFMISDGVIPSNEGRGYVLRRILRRASRHGKLLGINRMFLPELCRVVIGENKAGYPELEEKMDYILKVISIEEERFNATIDSGLSILNGIIEKAKAEQIKTVSGEDAFKLYDTFGFPIDLTREILAENGLETNEEEFAKLMADQRDRARSARANISGWSDQSKSLLTGFEKTVFTGYTEASSEAEVIGIIGDDGVCESISEGEFTLVLDKTPFYGEGGGQVGDTGVITGDGLKLEVVDTKKSDGVYIHICNLVSGSVRLGDKVKAQIDTERRDAIKRNHSAAHLLQAALREVLGTHVEQAGSYVDPERVRFDFTHFAALSTEEIKKVEAIVNAHILAGEGVVTVETDIDQARKMGAMALFGEKYGSVVRVVKMGEFSTELCGGCHLDNTGKAGLFKIIAESSVAAGVRRIEGITGTGVLDYISEKETLISDTAKELKVSKLTDIAFHASHLQDELKRLKGEIESLEAKIAASKTGDIMNNVITVGSVRLVTAMTEAMSPDAARGVCDDLKAVNADLVVVIGTSLEGKLNFVAGCGKDAVAAGAHAGKLLSQISAIAGGKGGGRPDNAMSGATDAGKMEQALAAAEGILADMIK